MYNRKTRPIHWRHNCIRQLISTGVVSVDYIKSKDNLVNQLTKGLNRDFVDKKAHKRTSQYNGNPTMLTRYPKINNQIVQTNACNCGGYPSPFL